MAEGNTALGRYESIAEFARARLSASRDGKPRVVVQVGHCGVSAGGGRTAGRDSGAVRRAGVGGRGGLRWRLLRGAVGSGRVSLRRSCTAGTGGRGRSATGRHGAARGVGGGAV